MQIGCRVFISKRHFEFLECDVEKFLDYLIAYYS